MRLVVWAIKIHTIPARREDNIRPDTALTRRSGQSLRIELTIRARRTSISAEVGPGVAAITVGALEDRVDGALGRVASEHAEPRPESGDFAGCGGHVVHEDAAVDLSAEGVAELVADGRSV